MLYVQARVTIEDRFQDLEREILEQGYAGVVSMGQAVLKDAYESMQFGGAPKLRGRTGYTSAAEGEPPRWHSGKFRESLDMAVDQGRVILGSRATKVGLRGAWFEFGGRPLGEGEVGKPRRRKMKPHPWLGPALDRQLDTFVPRVAGTFV